MRRTSMPSDSSIPRRRTRASRSRPGIPTSVSTSSSCRWPGRSGSRTAAWWAARSRSRVRRIICRCWPSFGRPDQTARVILARLTIRTRIAPSPTGDPHVGTAYVALFNYAQARRSGGQFLLRIEDTDRPRSHPASERMIFEALRWLGLSWDEGPDVGGPCGPYRQSERSEIYREHAEKLVASGAAYPCFCTPERLAALREEQKRSRAAVMGYDRLCRRLDPEDAAKRRAAGEAHVIRLAMPDADSMVVSDLLRGELRFERPQMDDQVLLKSDGYPTYHLANVVDDHLMGITHVMRAEEWLSSLPKHFRLYEAFGWQAPVFCHLPLLRNADKSKISKRKNPVSLNHYRRAGYLPEAMLNFLALLSYSMPDEREEFSLADFIASFELERISLGGPVFDLEKLTW